MPFFPRRTITQALGRSQPYLGIKENVKRGPQPETKSTINNNQQQPATTNSNQQQPTKTIFFARLPCGQYGPVNKMSMGRQSNKYTTIQVHLIGAKPIAQMKQMKQGNIQGTTSYKDLHKQDQKSNTSAAHQGTQAPPGQTPRYTGKESNSNTRQILREEKNLYRKNERYVLTYFVP